MQIIKNIAYENSEIVNERLIEVKALLFETDKNIQKLKKLGMDIHCKCDGRELGAFILNASLSHSETHLSTFG